MDTVSKEKRSEIMSKIRGKDTKPEKIVRSLLHSMGYRFRLHRKDLPGKPDIVLPKYKTVIFVHGCFWHGHSICQDGHIPKSNSDYWKSKIDNNIRRDKKNMSLLSNSGWSYVIIWECETNNLNILEQRIKSELELR
ncbi:very short patch repair endonuclease [Oceanidesulfovibrio marinus]|uniref:Very short patch repair endonuclease n=2 Tax=Oceanidesulfovibrio marinus TaxID=370038 RepID=A0A6P1ZGC7_9BACT|nr:very short patch repair endonuclease [Oceanidesulfovibrio marinus]